MPEQLPMFKTTGVRPAEPGTEHESITCLSCGKELPTEQAPCGCPDFTREAFLADGVVWCPLRNTYLEAAVCASDDCLDPSLRPVCWTEVSDTVEVSTP